MSGVVEWALEHRAVVELGATIAIALGTLTLTLLAYRWTRRQSQLQALQELREGLQSLQLAALQDPELLAFIAQTQGPDEDAAARAERVARLRKAYFFFTALNIHRTAYEARAAGLFRRDGMVRTLRAFCRTYAHERAFLRAHILPEYPDGLVREIEREWRRLDARGGA